MEVSACVLKDLQGKKNDIDFECEKVVAAEEPAGHYSLHTIPVALLASRTRVRLPYDPGFGLCRVSMTRRTGLPSCSVPKNESTPPIRQWFDVLHSKALESLPSYLPLAKNPERR